MLVREITRAALANGAGQVLGRRVVELADHRRPNRGSDVVGGAGDGVHGTGGTAETVSTVLSSRQET